MASVQTKQRLKKITEKEFIVAFKKKSRLDPKVYKQSK